MLSELESGYANKASIHEGLAAIARDWVLRHWRGVN